MKSSIFEKIFLGLGMFFAFIALLAVICAVVAYPVMWLWNGCLVGAIDGIHPISGFWQALGILILCGLLFKSSGSSSTKS